MRWVLSEILSNYNDVIYDWENANMSSILSSDEENKIMKQVKNWVDIISDDGLDEKVKHCCYDLVLLFTLESMDEPILDSELDDIIRQTAETIISLLTCNNFTSSGISFNEWNAI